MSLRCPESPCKATAESVGAMAAHLITNHEQPASAAFDAARAARPPILVELVVPESPPVAPAQEIPMARPCGNCKTVGHGRKDCPGLKKAKRLAGPRAPVRAVALAAVDPGSSNGLGVARIQGLKQAVAAGLSALAELDAIRAALEA